MKNIIKFFQITALFILMAMFWCHQAVARTAFEEQVDSDADGICDSDFFPGPYYFCTPNANDKPDNCPDVANPDQADADGDGIGDACDTPDNNGGNATPTPDPNAGNPPASDPDQEVPMPDAAGGCSLVTYGENGSAVSFMATLLLGLSALRFAGRRKSN